MTCIEQSGLGERLLQLLQVEMHGLNHKYLFNFLSDQNAAEQGTNLHDMAIVRACIASSNTAVRSATLLFERLVETMIDTAGYQHVNAARVSARYKTASSRLAVAA